MARIVQGTSLASMLFTGIALGQVSWHSDLAYSGGGYWPARVSVTVHNVGTADVVGVPVRVTIGSEAGQANLVGLPVQSIRVVNANNQELLHECMVATGLPKHEGLLEAGDVVVLSADVLAGQSAEFLIYAGNEAAWVPPDYFGASFTNGGFELGETTPFAWKSVEVDSTHRMFWQQGGARSGERCARCEVDPGAEHTWVKYMQGPIPVIPGGKYRFTAWVKAENVVGQAGWFIHVNGEQPQLVNKAGGWERTFDWREVVIDFKVPPTGTNFVCGTILRGNGVAWYDDAMLEALDEPVLRVTVGEVERMNLKRIPSDLHWEASETWPWRTPVLVRNFTNEKREALLVSVNMRRPRTLLAKHAGWRYDLPVRIIDPDSPDKPLRCSWMDAQLLMVTSLPPHSEKVLMVYWSPAQDLTGASEVVDFASLVDDKLNLAQNGSMEKSEEAAEGWSTGAEGGSDRFSVRRIRGGLVGDWCLELNVPKTVENPGWVGSRQRVSVEPNTRYLLAGYISSTNLSGKARIHGHFQKADGSLSDFGPFFGTWPEIGSDANWTLTSTQVLTPPDCAFIEIHLTMNTTGTLRHDGVVLLQVDDGEVGALEQSDLPKEDLVVWPVNPLVKVFPEDIFPSVSDPIHLYACRNESEPLQLALRASRTVPVAVLASALEGPGGAKIASPKAYRVGYVPIDFPIGYASSTQPAHHRVRPTTPGSDGWVGDWPDPLVPLANGAVKLKPNRTEAVWFDYTIPADARPGDYSGTVIVQEGEIRRELPVRLTVWPYTLPDRKHCKAIYDLRSGPGHNIFSNGEQWEMIEAWYRLLDQYHISPGIIHPSPQYRYETGKLIADYTEWDRACEILFDKLNCNIAYTPWFFYALGWAYPPRQYFGFEPFTPEWTEIFQSGLRGFYDHMAEKGWDKYFVYYLSDEPHENVEGVVNNLNRIADLARQAVPGILVYSSTWHHIKGMDGHLNLWGIGPHGTFPLPDVEERRAAGDRFWFTTDGQMCIDTPYLAIERLLPWFCFKYEVEAYEFWGVSWWTYDPWKYGWHTYIRQSNEGKDYYWVRYPNGDGYLTYPGEHVGQKEPLPSIRLVAVREGMEDYEIFHALRGRAGKSAEAKRALDGMAVLLEIPNAGGRHSTKLMPNPDAVRDARIAAGKALAGLLE
ncbi:MAG: glycoside hydrolase domain-containing protein [Candidatus Zipacnadales bacterium]